MMFLRSIVLFYLVEQLIFVLFRLECKFNVSPHIAALKMFLSRIIYLIGMS